MTVRPGGHATPTTHRAAPLQPWSSFPPPQGFGCAGGGKAASAYSSFVRPRSIFLCSVEADQSPRTRNTGVTKPSYMSVEGIVAWATSRPAKRYFPHKVSVRLRQDRTPTGFLRIADVFLDLSQTIRYGLPSVLLHRHLGAGITEIRTIPRLGASLVIMRVSHGLSFLF